MARAAPFVLLLALSATAAPKSSGPSLRWAPSWDEAVEEAVARNVPIVVHRHGFY